MRQMWNKKLVLILAIVWVVLLVGVLIGTFATMPATYNIDIEVLKEYGFPLKLVDAILGEHIDNPQYSSIVYNWELPAGGKLWAHGYFDEVFFFKVDGSLSGLRWRIVCFVAVIAALLEVVIYCVAWAISRRHRRLRTDVQGE